MKYFVSADVHSFYTPWMQALNEAGFDKNNPNHKIILCGDAFDRGNESNQVLEFIKDMLDMDKLIYVKGNHELLLKDCCKQIKDGLIPSPHHWHNGTVKTICQLYGVPSEWIILEPDYTDLICDAMQSVLGFIDKNSVNFFETKNYIFVHSTIPNVDNWRNATNEDWKEAMWKNPFSNFNPVDGKTIVFGHWHTSWARHQEFGPNADFSPYYGNGYIGIDTCTARSGKVNVLVVEDEIEED